MLEAFSEVKSVGVVERTIEYRDGRREVVTIPNTVLKAGRRAWALALANQLGGSFNFYISRMIFGDGGTQNGTTKKYVNSDRNGLFGVTKLSKPVIANIDSNVPTQLNLTAVIKYDEAVGVALNEMALQMSNGDLYSMTTFPDLSKTEEMQVTWVWYLSFI
jgi:hypothetical protein